MRDATTNRLPIRRRSARGSRALFLVLLTSATLVAFPRQARADLTAVDVQVLTHAQNVYEPPWAPEASRQPIDSFWQRQDVSWPDWSCVGAARDYGNAMIQNDGFGSHQSLPDGTTYRNIEGPSHTTTVVTTPDGRHWMADDYLGFTQYEEMVQVEALNPKTGKMEPAFRFKGVFERSADYVDGQPISIWGEFGGTWFYSDFADAVHMRKVDGQWVPIADWQEGGQASTGVRGGPDRNAASVHIESRESVDPNAKEGPYGPGALGPSVDGSAYDGGYLAGNGPHLYTIHFENRPSATAHAQVVEVTDDLDESLLDLSSFEWGPVTVLDRIAPAYTPRADAYVTHVDLRPGRVLVVRVEASVVAATGSVAWTFTSLDPASCEQYECMAPVDPADPGAGFLPPGAGGSVSFRVHLQEALADGTRIENGARITFDPHVLGATTLPTNTWINTIDRTPPASRVEALAPVQHSPSFPVRWAGDDAGSGIREYAVFVSRDGGVTWTEWIDRTIFTEAVFQGAHGWTYAFRSVALDRAGNRESPPAAPDAVTTVDTESGDRAIIAVGPVRFWVGLKNSDDQGTRFDLRVELLSNGVPVASGLARCISGVTRAPSRAREIVVRWEGFSPTPVHSGDVVALRVSARIGTNPDDTRCTQGRGGSHGSARGLRLYYDSAKRPSGLGLTVAPAPGESLYLHSDGRACPAGGGPSPGVTTRSLSPAAPAVAGEKCTDSRGVNFAGGNPFAVLGTWSQTPLP
jgi:hypothetical protein